MSDCNATDFTNHLTPATWTSSTRPQVFANQTFGSLQVMFYGLINCFFLIFNLIFLSKADDR